APAVAGRRSFLVLPPQSRPLSWEERGNSLGLSRTEESHDVFVRDAAASAGALDSGKIDATLLGQSTNCRAEICGCVEVADSLSARRPDSRGPAFLCGRGDRMTIGLNATQKIARGNWLIRPNQDLRECAGGRRGNFGNRLVGVDFDQGFVDLDRV